ncbi:MAG: polysaccharide biosynthesis/export family protein [Planctomycetota bacterium]
MEESSFLTNVFDRKFLPAILIFLLITTLSEVTLTNASEANKQKALGKVAQEWIQVGMEQSQRDLFKAAEQSFREKAQIAGPQRKQILAGIKTINRLVEQGKLIQAKAYLDKVKNSQYLTREEREKIAKRLKEISNQLETPELIVVKNQLDAVPSRHVALVPGDVIEVRFYYTPDLNVTQTVRPDGKISFQLVGEVMAQGKSPAELRDELLKLFTPHLKAPEITVIVQSFYDRRVFVGGKVMTPGIVQMPGKMTLLEAIMEAGGFDLREAEVKNVVVIRHKGGKRQGYALDMKASLAGEETEPFFLEPKDIVYVPRTEIAVLGQWIDQHINKIIPDTGVFVIRRHGDTSIGMGSYR